jgi:hypothetical protein
LVFSERKIRRLKDARARALEPRRRRRKQRSDLSLIALVLTSARAPKERNNQSRDEKLPLHTLLATSAAKSLCEKNSSSCIPSMTPTCEATSGHCEVIATSLRHRKPWTFKASCGSSSRARRPAADVKRLEEEEDEGIVVAAAISVAFFTAIYLRVYVRSFL